MTSKLVVNTIEADTGISSVSFASSISMDSTSKFHFSAAGVDIGADTNINRPAAGVLGFNISGVEKVRIDSSGHMHGVGVVTATHFYGNGANLTSLPAQATIANNADNRIITGGSGVNLNGEANLTFDGSNVIHAGSDGRRYSFAGGGSSHYMKFDSTLNGIILNGYGGIAFETNGTNERLRIDSSGNVNFGAVKAVALPSGTGIQVYNSSTPRIKLVNDTTGNAAGDGFQIYVSGSSAILDQKENAEMRFYTNATEKLRITSGGQVNIGNALSNTTRMFAVENTLANGGEIAYIGNNDGASNYGGLIISAGETDRECRLESAWGNSFMTFYTNSGSSTEKLRIDSSGNAMFGTTSSTVYDDTSGSGVVIRSATGAVDIMRNNDHPLLLNRTGGDGQMIMFHRNGVNKSALCIRNNALTVEMPSGTEKVRITHDGDLLVGTTSNASGSNVGLKLNMDATNPTFNCVINQGTGNHSFYHLFNTNGSNNGYRFYVMANGGIANHSGNNSNLSDERMKKNITNMGSVYNSFKQFVFKDFNYITDEDSDIKKHGVIAQEVETIDSDLITDDFKIAPDSEGNDVYRKALKEEQFMMIGMKALQEAITEIETLKAKVAALEGS